MKRLIFAALLLATLTGCHRQEKELLAMLEDDSIGMVISNHGELSTYGAPGVQDLLRLTAEEPERMKGAVVADKRVGKAAASLLIAGEVKRVCTPLVSTPARKMLEQAGIALYAVEEIPLMLNKDKTDLCPMESKLLEAQTAEDCVAILRGGSLVGRQMLQMLNEQGLSLLVYNDSVLTTHDNRGIQDLVQLITDHPERLRGAIVADKIIGRSAAALMAAGGVEEVHTNVICVAGKELLESAGIKVFAGELTPMIRNREGTGMCPMDTRIAEAETVEECVEILTNMTKL